VTDVSFSLKSFQQAVRANAVDLHPSATDRNLLFHVDRPGAGATRLTFARMKGKTVTAMVMFTQVQHYEGNLAIRLAMQFPSGIRSRAARRRSSPQGSKNSRLG
jgi:hypothetical protein